MQKRTRLENDEGTVTRVDEDGEGPSVRLELEKLERSEGVKRNIVDTPELLRLETEKLRTTYAPYFRTERDFTDFVMLPIPPELRGAFIARVQEKEQSQK
jgi:hypothetical protein